MNRDHCFTKTALGVFIFVSVSMTACSSAGGPAPQVAARGAAEAVSRDLPATNPDVMYHVFAAEAMGAEGDYSGSASAYLEAALLSGDPEIAERAAKVAVSAGEWQLVVLASDRWAMLAPGSLDARELAAGSRLREGDYAGAEFQLSRLLELTASDRSRAWRVVAALLGSADDQERAGKVLENLSGAFDAGANADALFARSQMAARAGDLAAASGFAEQALEAEPERADLLAWSGRLAVNAGDAALALARYRAAWQADQQNQPIAVAYAELLKRERDFDTAQAVLAQLPDTPETRLVRIAFALDAGDSEAAGSLYRAFSGAPYGETPEAAFQAAQSAELLGLQREAIGWYQQVTGERSLQSIMRQVFLYAGLGELEEARNLLVGLRTRADDTLKPRTYEAEAQILQDAGRREEAIEVLGAGLAEQPGDTLLRYARALLAVSLGRLELAEADLREVIAAEPDNAMAINALGYTLADLTDRYDEAETLILKAYQLQPHDASIIDSMGWIAYRKGRLEEAEKYLREAWERMRNAEIAAHLGEVLWHLGRQDEARSVWESGLEAESGNEVLVSTMKRLGELP